MDYRMIVDSELLDLSIPERFVAYAESYCNGAIALTDQMKGSEEKNTWANAAVVLMLSAHSAELLMKGMILHREPDRNLNNTHDLDGLSEIYDEVYPEEIYRFDMPFKSDYLGMSDAEVETLKNKQKPPSPSILYRYPTKTRKSEWDGAFGFEAASYTPIISQLLSDIARLRSCIT